jgi:hypothetical protein
MALLMMLGEFFDEPHQKLAKPSYMAKKYASFQGY